MHESRGALKSPQSLKGLAFINDSSAVSPIVATLVLIVVAIIGATAVALIVGSFSGNVASQSSTGDISGQSGITIHIADSDIMKPMDQLLASQYNGNHTGSRIVVTTGSSDDGGVITTGLSVSDLGGVPRQLTADEKSKFPKLISSVVGGRAIVIIAHDDLTSLKTTGASIYDFQTLYSKTQTNLAANLIGVTKATRDTDGLGSDHIFANWVSDGEASSLADYKNAPSGVSIVNVGSEKDVISYVSSTPGSIGYVDWNLVSDNDPSISHFNVIPIINSVNGKIQTPDVTAIPDEISKMNGENYETGLVRQLCYVYFDPTQSQIMALEEVNSQEFQENLGEIGLVDSCSIGPVAENTSSLVGTNVILPIYMPGQTYAGYNGYYYISNNVYNVIEVVDTSTSTVVGVIPVGSNPQWWTEGGPDFVYLYVANRGSNTVSVIDRSKNTVIASVPVGNQPQGVMASPDGSSIYVTNQGSNTLSIIDIATNTVTATIPVGNHPFGIWVYYPSTAFITNYGDSTVSIFDTNSKSVTANIPVGNHPWGVAESPDQTKAYVSNMNDNTVSVINLATNTVIKTLNVGHHPNVMSCDGTYVYSNNQGDNTFSKIDPTTDTVIGTIPK